MPFSENANPAPESNALEQNSLTKAPTRRSLRLPIVLLLTAGFATASAALVVYCLSGPEKSDKSAPEGAAWSYDHVFPDWPKDRKPDFVIVLSGQTYGYLQKCGCSDPQRGGLERRWNFIAGLKSQGIEVVPIDLGDVAPQVSEDHKIIHDQAKLKYQVAMRSMKAMGYQVVGLGKEEFALGLHESLGEYSQQPGNELPRLVCANLVGWKPGDKVLAKKEAFPDAQMKESLIQDYAIIPTKSKLNVGVVAIVGDPTIKAINKIDSSMIFAPKSVPALTKAFTDMTKQKTNPHLAVLLYSGPVELAETAAKAFPQFRIVACLTEESEPPNTATTIKNTMLVQVGHKGQNIGAIGVFKNDKGGFELLYQRVSLTPEYETPAGSEKQNLALVELERYSKLVKDRQYLTMNLKRLHPLQSTNPKAAYVGSQACVNCHNEQKLDVHGDASSVWTNSKHAGAYNALVNIASKPSLRNFDGECIRCHTVGYDYNTGFVDMAKTPHLKDVGCESCHGPGSQHVANPNNKPLALQLSPWKINGQGNLPSVDDLKKYMDEKDQSKKQAMFPQHQSRILMRADKICQQCHNSENDPHFKFETFWPKIAHSSKAGKKENPKNNVALPEKDKDGPNLTPPSGPALELPKK